MLNGKGHITIAILVLLLGAVTMMFLLFRSEKSLKPTNVDQRLLRAQSAVKESSSRELAKRDRSSGIEIKKGRSREETTLPKQDNRRQKEFPEEKMAASLPGNKKTETTKGSGKPEVVEKGSPIDVFENPSSYDRRLKEEVETKKGNSSEESSLEKDTFTVVSKKDIEEIQRKTWAALEFLKD